MTDINLDPNPDAGATGDAPASSTSPVPPTSVEPMDIPPPTSLTAVSPPTPPVPPADASLAPFSPQDERLYSAAAHASGLVVPILGPIVVQAVAKGRSAVVDDNSREALNFQISWVLAALLSMPLLFIGVGICIFIPVVFGSAILMILAAAETYNGKPYRYPIALRLIK